MTEPAQQVDDTPTSAPTVPRRRWLVPVALLVLITIAVAWSRVGVLGLPSVPSGVTLEAAGLAHLDALARLDGFLRDAPDTARDTSDLTALGISTATLESARMVRSGLDLIERGDEPAGLALMRDGVRRDPSNIVLVNAYRMAVFQLQRAFLQLSHQRALLTPSFPAHLDNEPIAFLEQLASEHDAREVRLHLALAWVDRMLLFPALEIKAPSSVESVDVLTDLIEHGEPGYVPALFARGLNHLHRPARLVWPESDKTPPDAAARDIGLCVAIGRKVGAGSHRLQATLAIALGDAYIKAGRLGVARSWWQIAQNLSSDTTLRAAIRRRYAWHDEEVIDRLEEELDRARSELDSPMTDLAMMWN